MNNINKVISFILGLIVVIIILLVITGKFNILSFRNKLFTISKGSTTTKPTPTVVSKKSLTPTGRYLAQNTTSVSGAPTQNNSNITTIPSTGTPTELFLFVTAALLLGIYLMKVDSTY